MYVRVHCNKPVTFLIWLFQAHLSRFYRATLYVSAVYAVARCLNRLMRAGRTEEASAVAQRVAKEIVLRNKHRLSRINKKSCCRDMWAAVKQLTGRLPNAPVVDGVTAETLNQHYAATSTDRQYRAPQRRHIAARNSMSQCLNAKSS